MYIPSDLPLTLQEYYYIGETDDDFIQGKKYTAIETGIHWYRELGHVVWVAPESNKNTRDLDYCVSCGIKWFNKNFKRY